MVRVIDLDAEIADRAFELRVPKEQLDGSQVARLLVDLQPSSASSNACRAREEVLPFLASTSGSQSRIEARVCSLISNWTCRPIFVWMTVAWYRAQPPAQTSSTCKPHEVAASELANDGKIEKSEVPRSMLQLKPHADRPNLRALGYQAATRKKVGALRGRGYPGSI
jgi:hypothetical protein